MKYDRATINKIVANHLFEGLTWCIEPELHGALHSGLRPIVEAKDHDDMRKQVMVFMFNASKWADR